MPRTKKTTKKVAKKENINDVLNAMMDYSDTAIQLCDIQEAQIKRLGVAVWALTIFNVIFTASFLLLIYGNQYLVR